MTQLLCHLWGDYILQSDWMAQNKTKKLWIALVHATCYTVPFLFLTRHWKAIDAILFSHAVIDRWRLAKWVVAVKNSFLCPDSEGFPGKFATDTGYPETCPPWMAVWLLIIADNILHLTINFFALRYL